MAQYIDVEDKAFFDFPRIIEIVQNKEADLPVVMIDDDIIGSGYISYPRIVKELTDRQISQIG